jgi:hypothetical protein
MYPLATIAGGLSAALGILSLAVSGPASLALVSSALSPSPSTAAQVDRSHKGDRLGAKVAASPNQSAVTTVEVVGVRDTAIVYRDRDGRVLFRTDPVANVTIVAKDVKLPDVTAREHSNAAPQQVPVKTLREGDKEKRLEGCDPIVSPLSGSSLSQVAGRCIAGMATSDRVAMVMR